MQPQGHDEVKESTHETDMLNDSGFIQSSFGENRQLPSELIDRENTLIAMGYPVKTSQNQNVPSDLPKRPIFGESKRPKYIFTIFNQTRDSKHFLSQSQNVPSQNVPKSKCPKSKRPRGKTSQVKTSQSQNVLSQNVPKSKHPVKMSQSQNVPESKRPKSKCSKSKRPKSKRPKVKTFQVNCPILFVCL